MIKQVSTDENKDRPGATIQSNRFVIHIVFLIFLWCAGCAGNGKGLDENGNPIGSDGGEIPVAFEPTFGNIQQNVFTAICVECHIGSGAPEGLSLEASQSYEALVGVRSVERPDLFRVQPGDPDNSYIIRKLEGGPDIIGGQMPLDRPPLDQEVINSIRVWISRGAEQN